MATREHWARAVESFRDQTEAAGGGRKLLRKTMIQGSDGMGTFEWSDSLGRRWEIETYWPPKARIKWD